jgi:hypothetical protein
MFATKDKKDTKMKANKQAELEKAGWKIVETLASEIDTT